MEELAARGLLPRRHRLHHQRGHRPAGRRHPRRRPRPAARGRRARAAPGRGARLHRLRGLRAVAGPAGAGRPAQLRPQPGVPADPHLARRTCCTIAGIFARAARRGARARCASPSRPAGCPSRTSRTAPSGTRRPTPRSATALRERAARRHPRHHPRPPRQRPRVRPRGGPTRSSTSSRRPPHDLQHLPQRPAPHQRRRASSASKFRSWALADLSYVDIREYLKTKDLVLVPMASTEQHGPHLPLYTDTITAHRGERAGLRAHRRCCTRRRSGRATRRSTCTRPGEGRGHDHPALQHAAQPDVRRRAQPHPPRLQPDRSSSTGTARTRRWSTRCCAGCATRPAP